ncbi:hypothetical protein KC338_g2463 [Hortaea werneckii]|uniref:Uncharacterized protein n=2 Tax=Hortaea werneckii TaxID=91943 RepID=A0A3M7GMV6_HORWE|nr:hypothetical protein KC323_g2621 [Hortaea werneckii]KAI6871648.1 hypothetical protein KC338_g2463 [Hortaea werneckii]KAI7356174.1 hypothetical protein KC320_g2364 [Hortaea werneckii]RMZ02022.1 hypothetical protein D0862_06177 [Hortaea werneckii]
MASPPPVPPKDTPRKGSVDGEWHGPPSSSKRKRAAYDETIYDLRNGRLEPAEPDPDAHTPKRTRSNEQRTDGSSAEEAATGQRSLRRKKKVNNLSHLSLRQAAQQQKLSPSKNSKFQEGSLTDKPSVKPPSAFTRIMREDSGNFPQVDELMEDYDRDLPMDTVESAVDQEKVMMPQKVEHIAAHHSDRREEHNSGGLFRFGKKMAASFHPVNLWNKLWNETKEELTKQNMEEAERKRRQKEEAEAAYAQLKASGMLPGKRVGPVHDPRLSMTTPTPRDSGVVMPDNEHSYQPSGGSQFLAPPDNDFAAGASPNEMADFGPKVKGGTLRGRFSFKRPSMADLKSGIKRVRSDLNMNHAAASNDIAGRDSESSMSPTKPEPGHPGSSVLKKSASRYDIKKQNRLSKRVSDLESKLRVAREELNEALVEASPMPKLGNRYERFTPVSTMKSSRPTFIPGRLPTLPSERFLDPANFGFDDIEEKSPAKLTGDGASEIRRDMEEYMNGMDDEDEVPVKKTQSTPNTNAPRANGMFNLTNENIEALPQRVKEHSDRINEYGLTSELKASISNDLEDDWDDLDPAVARTANPEHKGGRTLGDEERDGDSIDVKLKKTETKKARAKPKSKKRKSGANEDDDIYKPGKDTDEDEDDEWDQPTPRKKRKSAGNSGQHSSPQVKKGADNVTKKTTKGKKKETTEAAPAVVIEDHSTTQQEADAGAVEPADGQDSGRRSLDSQAETLEPLYEEEELESTTTVALKGEPKKPTATATPARHARRGSQGAPDSEEKVMRRSVEGKRVISPPPPADGSKVAEVVREQVTAVPGKDGVPALPNQGKKSKKQVREDFEWPEDVF